MKNLDDYKDKLAAMNKEELQQEINDVMKRTLEMVWILDENKRPIHPETIKEYEDLMWGINMNQKIVAKDTHDNFYVSTVFLGIEHGFGTPPLFFETMVFDESGETSYNNDKVNEIYMEQ